MATCHIIDSKTSMSEIKTPVRFVKGSLENQYIESRSGEIIEFN